MNKKIEKRIDSFKTISESKKVFTILVYQEFIIIDEFQKEPEEIPGIKSLRTLDGNHVNRIDDETYEILGGLEVVRVKRI